MAVLYLAARDPRVPWYAKAVAGAVVAYALSPIDLILAPLGIALAIRLIPSDIFSELRRRADREAPVPRRGLAVAVVIVLIWLLVAVFVAQWLVDTRAP